MSFVKERTTGKTDTEEGKEDGHVRSPHDVLILLKSVSLASAAPMS